MIELAGLGVAAATADEIEKVAGGLLRRLLGPSADVLGRRWATVLENRSSNVRRVAELADKRTKGAGAIPARVADGVLQTAQFADSEFVAEYLGGILASSRTPDGRDDRGVGWTSLISQLSSDQIRLHYALYTAARPVIAANIRGTTDSAMCRVVMLLSFADIWSTMAWRPSEDMERFRDAIYGLHRQNLLGTVSHGRESFLRTSWPDIDIPSGGGLIYRVKIPGLFLYLWGFGQGGESATALLDPSFDVTPVGFDLPEIPAATYIEVDQASSGF